MGPSVSETILQKDEPVLQLKRSLLAIDEYAAGKGVSRTVVEECGRLGIVQIRKYKGKVFVVDVPFRPYSHSPETTDKNTQLADKGDQSERLSDLLRKTILDASKTSKSPMELFPNSIDIKAGRILALFERVKRGLGTVLAIAVKLKDMLSNKSYISKDAPVQIIQDDEVQLGYPAAQARSERTWQFTVVLLMPFLFAVLLACLWLYLDRKVQIDRLTQSYAGIQQLANDSMEAERKTKTIEDKLRASETEVERLKGELAKSQAEVNAARNELTRTRQSFETIQSNNAEVVNWLDEQIQELTEQLYELVENRQP